MHRFLTRGALCSYCEYAGKDIEEYQLNRKGSTAMISSPVQELYPDVTSEGTDGFLIYYDAKSRNPLCVVEKLSLPTLKKEYSTPGKRPHFFADTRIDEIFRVNPKEFTDSKYDRGHMVPAADFASAGSVLWRDTFVMSNISPQMPSLNKGFWARFENWIRDLVLTKAFDEILVFTGPVFAPTFVDNQWVFIHRTIGTFPRLITVPSHFFKFIVAKKTDPTGRIHYSFGTFLIPNSDIGKKVSLAQALVRLDQLEHILGFRILPEITNSKEFARVDSIVPSSRDLAVVLNANLQNANVQIGLSQLSDDEMKAMNAVTRNSDKANFLYNHLCNSKSIDCQKSFL